MAACLGVFTRKVKIAVSCPMAMELQLVLPLGRAALGSRNVTEAFIEVHRPRPPPHSLNASDSVGRKAWPLWCCFLCSSCLDPGLLLVHRETEPGKSRTCGGHPEHQQQSRELNFWTGSPACR